MMSSLRRFGALAGAVALALGLSACTDLTSSSNTTSSASPAVSASEIDYSACATDDSADQQKFVDRSGKGSFPGVTGDDTPVIAAGQGILEARAEQPGVSLADMYNPLAMSPSLLKAHRALDRAVDRAFGAKKPLETNEERLALLFKRYQEMTSAES